MQSKVYFKSTQFELEMTKMLKLCSLCLLVYGTDNRRCGGDSMDFKIRQGEQD